MTTMHCVSEHTPVSPPEDGQQSLSVTLFTQAEHVYLPLAVEGLVANCPRRVSSIVLAEPMATHGGRLRGLWKNLGVLGFKGGMLLSARVGAAHFGERAGLRPREGRYWSVRHLAQELNIPLLWISHVNAESLPPFLEQHPADLLVSLAFPQRIPLSIRKHFPQGGINVHTAPLPRYRGLMPAFWALYHDEPETAVTVHRLAEKLDQGEILLQRRVPIEETDSWDTLVKRTKQIAGSAVADTILRMEADTLRTAQPPQDDGSYFGFPTWADAREFRARGKRMF